MDAQQQQTDTVGPHNAECITLRVGGRTYGLVQLRESLNFYLWDCAKHKVVASGAYTDLAAAIARLAASAN